MKFSEVQTAARTSQTRFIFYNLYLIYMQGQDFSLKTKTKAKAKAWGVKAKAKAKTFMTCPRGSSRPRPGLEDNKTDIHGLDYKFYSWPLSSYN